MDEQNIISVKDLSFYYTAEEEEAPKLILENFDIDIKRGSFVAILGANGSGKSTLAKLFNGLLKPRSGKVLVNGLDTSAEDVKTEVDIKRTVGLVFQNPDNQIISTIVEEDIAFGPENLGVPPEEIRTRVKEALDAVLMYKYKDRPPHKLSGGQKQRIAIAGILAMKPQCIVLDEPTAMLDPKGRAEVIKTITSLNREHGITVIIITHHMEEVLNAQRVVVLKKGKIMMDDVPEKVFLRSAEMIELGLEVPIPTQLLDRLRSNGVNVASAVTAEQAANEIAKILEG